ncbi:SGNH/GDSL hydrolase family protein [Streptomyces sp. NBRC 110028]|uniref:SGNH/GDSL hydrolase family protein n=1 Tax=Streptomyces sp. NBRC 110028 TaxID=1621260 RepID=UPI000AA9604A|nr:SGNH/GDSL hydrolase family protein [Streptomyces sp. NBRC 110028]
MGASGRAVPGGAARGPGGAGTDASASSGPDADAVAQRARHAESADRACAPGGGRTAAPGSAVPPGPAAPPRHVVPSGPAAARRGARPTPDGSARPAVPTGNGRCPSASASGAATGPQPAAPEADGDAASAPAVPTTRFAALGDSLTEGLGDPVTGGGWRGWAAGRTGSPSTYVNVSRSGALAADVAGERPTAARRARPRLASVVVGMNDRLRGTFDIRRVAEALDATIGALRADGTVVLTACLPDPGRMLGLPDALARPPGRRMRAVTAVVHSLSGRYGAVHVELTGHGWVTDRAAWSVDRLHPSELGHRLPARESHAALTARGVAMGDPPSTALDGPEPSRAVERLVDGDPRHALGRGPLYRSAARTPRTRRRGRSATGCGGPDSCSTGGNAGPRSPRCPGRHRSNSAHHPRTLRQWRDDGSLGILDRPWRYLHRRRRKAPGRPPGHP